MLDLSWVGSNPFFHFDVSLLTLRGGPGHGFSLRIFSSLFCFYGWSEVGVFKADSTSVELTKDPSGPFSFPKEGPHKQPVIRQEFVMLSKTERTKIFFCKTNLIVWKNKEWGLEHFSLVCIRYKNLCWDYIQCVLKSFNLPGLKQQKWSGKHIM